ncbi:methyltransferase domain-containing protein [Synechococcus sp. AH-551-N17]|nr:methyltransferase domain-containing protein [Synechococcus sp. AH-551-N17]
MSTVQKLCLLILRRLIKLYPSSRALKVLYSRFSPSIKTDQFARSYGVVELLAYLGKLDTNQPVTEEYIISRFKSKASHYDTIVEKAGYLDHELEICSESTFSIADSLCKKPVFILDIGCGTGLLASRLFQKGIAASIDGVDLSPEMLQEAQRRNIYSNLFSANATSYLTESSKQYDIIVACSVVPFFPPVQLESLIKAANSSISDGGSLVFTFDVCGGEDYRVNKKLFCEHSTKLVKGIAQRYFSDVRIEIIQNSRIEAGEVVSGAICICSKMPS